MSVSHQLNYGMLGRETPQLITMLPRRGQEFHGVNEPDTRNQMYGSIRGTDNPLKTLDGMINGGVRGVMPCCGNQSSMVNGTRVLKREPIPSSTGMVVPQGAFKSEMKGLASLPTKPLNAPPQRMRDFCYPDMFSKTLPAPFRVSS